MKDTYGFTPAEESPRRVEHFEPEWEEPITEPPTTTAAPAVASTAPPAPDYSDTAKWVKVERPEVTVYVENDSDDGSRVIRRHVLTGRMETFYRERRPEDGDAAVVREKANIPEPAPLPTMERHRFFDPFESEHRRPTPTSVRATRSRQENAPPRNGSSTPGRGFLLGH